MIDLTHSDDDEKASPIVVDLTVDSQPEELTSTIENPVDEREAKRIKVDEPEPANELAAANEPAAANEIARAEEPVRAVSAAPPSDAVEIGYLTVDFSKSHGFACQHEDDRDKGKCCRRNSTIDRHLCYDADGVYAVEREPGNAFDANAIMVLCDGAKVGFVPRDQAAALAAPLDEGMIAFKGAGARAGRHKVTFILATGAANRDKAVPDEVSRLVET
mmetsp:Transcript_23523/g.76024  ORF Transcript_23523/g.76024 Transcript_23523/m.76024 type:complete len:218 (-) Transcript_23523:68-721(-)